MTEGQDGEQETIDDEDNANDADSSTPCPQITNPIGPRLPARKALKRKFDVQYGDPGSSHLDFYSEKMTEIADQLVLSHTGFEGIDTDTIPAI